MKMRGVATTAWATLCVLVSHYAGYFFAFDDPHARQHALEGSGHTWYGLLLPAVVFGLGLGAAATVLDARRDRMSRTGSIRALYLTALFGLLFVEFFERLAHLGSLSEVLHNLSTPASFVPILLAAALLLLVVVPFVWVVSTAISNRAARRQFTSSEPPIMSSTPAAVRSLWFSRSSAPRGPPLSLQGVSRPLFV